MKELYFVITSDEEYIPNLVEEYVLAACIDEIQDLVNMDGEEDMIVRMPHREKIPDLGCGSGRDTKAFVDAGCLLLL